MRGREAAMAAVLRDDDLLREILLRLGFSAFLVRAALVSKRWLGLASAPAFLRRFRDRHPGLIGFYINDLTPRPRFVRVSKAPELHSVVRCASFDANDPFLGLLDCHNGRLLLELGAFTYGGYAMRNPLCTARAMLTVVPPLPLLPDIGRLDIALDRHWRCDIFLSRDSSDGFVYTDLRLAGRKLSVQVYVRRPSGAWDEHILPAVELSAPSNGITDITMPVHGKLCMVTASGYIHCLDFVAPRPQLCSMKLPDNVGMHFKLAYRNASGPVLIHGEGFELSVWHNHTDGSGQHNWVLLERFRVLAAQNRGEEISVVGGGDEADFVFLWLQESGAIVCVNLRNRQETVYEVEVRSRGRISVFPLMTIWPPTFPALDYQDNHDN